MPDKFRIEREVRRGSRPGDLPCLPMDYACQDERQAMNRFSSGRKLRGH